VGVVVLDADEVHPLALQRVVRGQVLGVEVVGHDLRRHIGEPLEVLDPLGEGPEVS